MFSFKVTLKNLDGLRDSLAGLTNDLTPEALIANVLEPAALVGQRIAVETTKEVLADRGATVLGLPRFYIAKPEDGWVIVRPEGARRILENGKVEYLNVDRGTANEGTGFILPKNAQVLYIPLNRRAAAGWTPALKPGVDYIVRKRVRGIKPRNITPMVKEKVETELTKLFNDYVEAVMVKHFGGGGET